MQLVLDVKTSSVYIMPADGAQYDVPLNPTRPPVFSPIGTIPLSAFLVLNTLRKMYKTEFCLNNHTNGRNTNFNNKQNREWIYAATLSNKNTASVGVNIRNYREACIIINGHRKSGSIMIVDDVLHFIAPEAGTGTMAFMYLVKVNIVNGGFGLYVEAANRICFLESNAWLENRNWSNSFNLYIR